eukprot:gene23065-46358_t
MMTFKPMTNGWSPQLYGLGLMHTFPYGGRAWAPDPENVTFTIGHAGADYGSLGMMVGYNWRYQFGIAFTTNSANALNCTLPYNLTLDRRGRFDFFVDALCPTYDAVLRIVSNGTAPRLNCASCPPCPSVRPPSPACAPSLLRLCGAERGSAGRCVSCVHAARRDLTAAGCTVREEYAFCGRPLPPPPPPPPSPAVACTWHI